MDSHAAQTPNQPTDRPLSTPPIFSPHHCHQQHVWQSQETHVRRSALTSLSHPLYLTTTIFSVTAWPPVNATQADSRLAHAHTSHKAFYRTFLTLLNALNGRDVNWLHFAIQV